MVERRRFEDFEMGEQYETEGRTVTDSDIRQFVGASGSTDPIHVDREYADAHPLVDDVVLQGTLLLGIADGFLVDAIASDAALAMNYGHDEVRYLESVSPGETVHAEIEIVDTEFRNEAWGLVTARVELVNDDGETAVIDVHRLLVATGDNDAV
ncbi:MaoC/PaaZ C-terminal domain-containing protein [Natrinema sp. DC36]|uniref:MaoC/PaaZ C-terminal domain-containing protein n=1 Tax=Natrinema sp. DC36 TaxID=2878680 RepID=UPI001CF0C71E|nr:MaoC/PaaZ C-terminal domain-containing protein [Natrinema sp. DC36]